MNSAPSPSVLFATRWSLERAPWNSQLTTPYDDCSTLVANQKKVDFFCLVVCMLFYPTPWPGNSSLLKFPPKNQKKEGWAGISFSKNELPLRWEIWPDLVMADHWLEGIVDAMQFLLFILCTIANAALCFCPWSPCWLRWPSQVC